MSHLSENQVVLGTNGELLSADDSSVNKPVAIDSWGCVTSENQQSMVERTNRYKDRLIELARTVNGLIERFVANNGSLHWYISDGSLLGAYRDQRMIEHDYDFDFAIFGTVEAMRGLYEWLVVGLEELNRSTPDVNYQTRIISDYANKIEVYDVAQGTHDTVAGPWYNVAVDLQLQSPHPENKDLVQVHYFKDRYNEKMIHTKKAIFPLKTICFEGCTFPCPGDVKLYLEENYGCIERGAVYDPATCKYRLG